MSCKVENILKGSPDSIPSPSVKIQIMGGKVCLRCKGKTLLEVVNKLLKSKRLFTSQFHRPSRKYAKMYFHCQALFDQDLFLHPYFAAKKVG